MTCPDANKWNLLTMELLSETESAELLAHARTCEVCQAALGHARRDHTSLLRAFEVFEQRHDELRNELLATPPAPFPRPRLRLVRAWQSVGDVVMNLSASPRRAALVLAPAACILMAVGIFLYPGKTGVAFAQVLERMRMAQTMVCDYTSVGVFVDPDGGAEEHRSQGTLSMYSDDATRAWRIDLTDPPSTQWTFPDHYVYIDAQGNRTVVKVTDDPNGPAALEAPEEWLDRLLSLSEAPDRELGSDIIDGQEAIGFEIAGWRLGLGARPIPGATAATGSSSIVRLWVDPNTRLPVRMHVENAMTTQLAGVVTTRMSMTWERFEWDVPLDPQSFQPPPPDASAPVDELEVNVSEEGLLDGLRAYSAASKRFKGGRHLADLPPEVREMLDRLEKMPPVDQEAQKMARDALGTLREFLHGYPKELDVSAILRLSIIAPNISRAKVIAARPNGDEEAIARAQEEAKQLLEELTDAMEKMSGAIVFYSRLQQEDRQPEYFGATVPPGDSTAVLVQWKHDDQHLRVVYGDLRVETVRVPDGNHGQQDVPLDAPTFPPPPSLPDESAPDQLVLEMPAPTEETFIEGLRAYAAQSERIEAWLAEKRADIGEDPEELERLQTTRDLLHLNSIYPTQLDLASLSIASVRESGLARAREIRLRNLGHDEEADQAAEEGARASKEITEAVGPTGLFYRRLLLEDREPEYFGATVQPGDSNAVLVRWKYDDRHQRVIYGDLRVETVPIED